MAKSSFHLSYWQRFRMWFLSKRTGRLLAIISSVQASVMAYIGCLVWLNHIGAAAQLITPVALVTLGTVLLVELSILTKMTQDGAVKASLVADVNRRYAVNAEKIVDFDPMKHMYYLRQAEWMYLESNEAVAKIVKDREHKTHLSHHREIESLILEMVDQIQNTRLNQDVALTCIRKTFCDRFTLNDDDKLTVEVFTLHVLRRLKFEAHDSKCAFDDSWLPSVIEATEAKLVVAQYNHENTHQHGSAYSRRGWAFAAMALFVVAPAGMIWGWMGYYQVTGSLIPLLAQLGLSVGVMTSLALPFAVLMGLAYFLQIYQTMSFSIVSGFWSRWWQSMKNVMGQMWFGDDKLTLGMIMKRAVGSLFFLAVTFFFLFLAVSGAMCGVLTYQRIFDFNKVVQWIELVSLGISESSYGLIYTAFSSMLINRMLMYVSFIGHFFDRVSGEWWDEYGALFQLNKHTTESRWMTALRLFPASIGLLSVGLMTFTVGIFETVIFFIHSIMMGFFGDNNPVLNPSASDGITAATEVGNDAGLFFGKEEHDHGLFDDLKHLIYRVITFLPAMVSALCLLAAPESDKTRGKYKIHVSPWHTKVVTKGHFLYQWASLSAGHIKEDNGEERQSPRPNWAARWEQLRGLLLLGIVAYMVLSVFAPGLHLLSVGGWLLLKLSLVSQVAPWMNVVANTAVLALTCTLYSLVFGKLQGLFYRSVFTKGIEDQKDVCDQKVLQLHALKQKLVQSPRSLENAQATHEVDQMIASLGAHSALSTESSPQFELNTFLDAMQQRRWSEGSSQHTRSHRWACSFFARYEDVIFESDNTAEDADDNKAEKPLAGAHGVHVSLFAGADRGANHELGRCTIIPNGASEKRGLVRSWQHCHDCYI